MNDTIFLERYLNPRIKNVRRLTTTLRYRIAQCLWHQKLIDEFIHQYEACKSLEDKLMLCRGEVGSILCAAYQRRAQDQVEPDETHTLVEAVRFAQGNYDNSVKANGSPSAQAVLNLGRAVQAARTIGVEVEVDGLGRVVSIDGKEYRRASLLDGVTPKYADDSDLSPKAAKIAEWGQ